MHSSIRTTLSIALALSLFSGCAPQPAPQKQITIDSSLPIPSLNGQIADITSVAFEWKPIEDPRVAGFYIYRDTPGSEDAKLHRIATVDNRYSTHFVDNDLKPATRYQYRFSAYTEGGSESVGSETIQVNTLPMIAPVSFFRSVGNMPNSAKLLWRPHTNNKISSYEIERQDANDAEWKTIATVRGRLNPEYIDRDLKPGHVYSYRIRAVTHDSLVTDPSEIAKVVTKPLPAEIKNISATSNLPRSIALSWGASSAGDHDHYAIYRSLFPNGIFEYHTKTGETTFTDKIAEDGKFYYYKVVDVDKDGLESPLSTLAVQGSTLSKPRMPLASDGKITNGIAELSWINNDPRTVSFTIVKTTAASWVSRESIEIKNIRTTTYRDTSIKPNTKYLYEIMSVDANGIRSFPTAAIELSYEAK